VRTDDCWRLLEAAEACGGELRGFEDLVKATTFLTKHGMIAGRLADSISGGEECICSSDLWCLTIDVDANAGADITADPNAHNACCPLAQSSNAAAMIRLAFLRLYTIRALHIIYIGQGSRPFARPSQSTLKHHQQLPAMPTSHLSQPRIPGSRKARLCQFVHQRLFL
jgi:hypothetical protein